MKKIFTLIFLLAIAVAVNAQSSDNISYQAVVRNAQNELLVNQKVAVAISILQGSAEGTNVYAETHAPSTNANGLITFLIGNGAATSGDFSAINWSAGPYFIQTDIDPTGGRNFTITTTSQLLSVPFALHAKTAESISGELNYTETDPIFSQSLAADITESDISKWNETITDTKLTEAEVDAFVDNNGYLTTEVDGSITNEIQDLDLTGNILTITNNGTATTIDLSKYLDNIDTQLTEAEVDDFVANNGYLTSFTEVDGDSTNEIQDLQLVGNNLTITKNGTATTIDLSKYLDNTDSKLTEAEVDDFVANNGYLITELDGSVTNEIQSLSLSGKTLTISGGNSVDLTAATSSATYAIGDQLYGGIVFYVDPSGQHGLICAKEDQSTGMAWQFGAASITGAQCIGIGGGYMNTMLIIAAQKGDYGDNYAAKVCARYFTYINNTAYGGWYLPNIIELQLIQSNKAAINTTAATMGGSALIEGEYWSSREGGQTTDGSAQTVYMQGGTGGRAKTDLKAVRAIKAF